MEFTYDAYRTMIRSLLQEGYAVTDYHSEADQSVILRHDIDFSPEKALKLALLEQEEGVCSTWFVLVTSDFYNPFSARNAIVFQRIMACGHEIGLHFDETRYPECRTVEELGRKVQEEAEILADAIGKKATTVSMHRPSRMMLEADLQVPGIINSYGKKYFQEYKYVSDSRRRWREDVNSIILSGLYPKLQILTHAFWYEEKEKNIRESVEQFIYTAERERTAALRENITNLDGILNGLNEEPGEAL